MEARPTAIIIGSYNILTRKLVEDFLAKSCKVVVVTTDISIWQRQSSGFSQNNNFILQGARVTLPEKSSYGFLVVGVEAETKFTESEVEKFFNYFSKQELKVAVVLPYLINEKNRDEASVVVNELNKKSNPNIRVFYLGEVFGAGLIATGGYTNSTLFLAATKTRLNIPEYDFEVFPVYIADATKEIAKGVLSYNAAPKQSVVAEKMSLSKFLSLVQKAKPSLTFVRDTSAVKPREVLAPSNNFSRLASLTKEEVKETLDWIITQGGQRVMPVVKVPDIKKINLSQKIYKPKTAVNKNISPKVKPKRNNKSNLSKYFLFSSILLIWLLLMPFLALFVSGISLKKAYSDLSVGQTKRADTFLTVSGKASDIAKFGFGVFAKVPLVGKSFKFFLDTTHLTQEGTQIGKKSIEISNNGKELLTGILGSSDYNLTGLSEKLYLDLDGLYQDLSLFQTEIDSYPPSIVKLIPQSADIKSSRKIVEATRDFTKRLPLLLGVIKPQTYLVLFQNNMELRPTGGFIGSFGLITFEKGKLTDSSIFDVYSADGQLKGHVEPPAAIKSYLGEANWYLRDSNWDPDFPTSSAKAEWFLGKEIDRPVDGVVGVDLEVAKSLLTVLGPIKLADFNTQIDAKNMYDKIEYEVQNNFFPGSQKKASILTALSQGLIDELTTIKPDNYLSLGKAVFDNLNSKHIQVFLHDKLSQEVISKANWEGSVSEPECSGNCQKIWLGMVDANVGVDKANYFIKRSANLTVNISSNQISHALEVSYVNNAPTSSGLSGNYKNYLRVLTPIDASFTSNADITEISGHKEAGLLVEVPAGSSKKVIFTWTTPVTADFTKPGNLAFSWRKQAGVGADPVNVRFTTNVLSLTRAGLFGYNTTLSTDLLQKINW